MLYIPRQQPNREEGNIAGRAGSRIAEGDGTADFNGVVAERSSNGRFAHRPASGRLDRLLPLSRRRALAGKYSISVSGVLFASVLALVGGPTLMFASLGGTVLIRRVRQWRASRKHAALIEQAIPDVFDVLTSLLRAGLSPAMAFADLAPAAPAILRPHLERLALRRRNGIRFADALTELGNELPSLRSLCDTVSRAERYGDPIEPIIDRLGDDAQQRRRRHMEISARQLPVRLCFPLVCCTLPAFVLLTIVPLLAGALSSLRQSF